MKNKEQVANENNLRETISANDEKITYYKTDFRPFLFLDGDESGSEDITPYKTNYQPEDK